MDITETLAPKSDQLDAIELVTGPRIFTVERVTAGSEEQPVNVHLVDFPRPWRPGVNMRRVLAACWGTDGKQWAGRSVELYYDPEVTFGREKPGGTRIRRLSHIDKTTKVPVLQSRRTVVYTIEPLPADAVSKPQPVDFHALVKAATTSDECRAIWKQAGDAGVLDDDLQAAIKARATELDNAATADEPEPDDGFLPSGDAS